MKTNRLLLISLASLPMLLGCNNTVSDKLDDINKLLADNKENIDTCYDAVNTEGVKEKLLATTLSGGNEYVYDSKAKQFVVMNGDKIVQSTKGYEASKSTLDYFKFVYTYNPNSQYSQYLLEDGTVPDDLIITTGFDAGNHSDIKNVIYSNFSTTDDNVIIRPYSDYLKIEAPYQTITHYDDSTNIIVENVKQLNTCGTCSYLKMKKGTVNFDVQGATQMFEIEKGCNEDVYIKSTTESYVYSLANCTIGEGEHEVKYPKAIELVEADILTEQNLRDEAKKSAGSGVPTLLRLESDIIVEKTAGAADLEPIIFNHQTCLDLNGFKLSLSDFEVHTTDNIREAIRIESSSDAYKSVYLIDSNGLDDEHSGIFLNNCSIVVAGIDSDKYTSNLAMNSGKITQTITGTTVSDVGAAVTLLGNKDTTGNPKRATFYMTGGKITVNNETATKNNFSCVSAEGLGADVDVLYGDLVSDDYCIKGTEDKLWAIEEKDDYMLNLVGASLTSNDNSCIYLPSPAKVNIYESTLVGATCVNMNSGVLNINRSTLTSNGTGSEYSSRTYDGSVIYAPKDKYDEADLNVTVKNNCNLYSKFAYIFNVTDNTDPNKTSLTFENGTYSYKEEGDGIVKNSNTDVLTKKGTWTRRTY